ncbi:MAG: hypothetical protein IRY83_17620, partial [Chloroflexi bacterium]|nr:hypothetical protein [Chloroflexota bacterium]
MRQVRAADAENSGGAAKGGEPMSEPVKLVRGRPWPKGVSGNPGGRPKDAGRIRELARQYT